MSHEQYKILSKRFGRRDAHKLAVYEAEGGYAALRKALQQGREKVIEEVKEAGLRGRGGAGFPTGVKWGFVPKDAETVYFMVNADESEPGTFKDRFLMDYDPHLVLEGSIISSYAVRASLCVIYIRGEFGWLIDRMQAAVDEAYAKGYLGKDILGSGYDLQVIVHKGAGAYICGEETGLINSVTGRKGQPSIKPPFPAVQGFLDKPTVVNNVESVAAVPHIVTNGAAEYRKFGTEKSAGTKLFSVSGPVRNPGVHEIPLGLPFKEFFHDWLGGMADGEKLKAVIVGGSSVPVLTADEAMGIDLDYESCGAAGTMLGSGGMIIIPERCDMVELIQVLMHFYWDESCGQCTPCREGTGWLHKLVRKLRRGEGTAEDLALIEKVCEGMAGLTICPLSDAAVMPMRSFLQKFRSEFEALVAGEDQDGPQTRWAREYRS
ncbi:MAG TPA: NADH-quinone oxidoreductase subunit NuoF [Candidatus Krumholzibacteria bacterium]|nr:NADH-quinone oxidoreductase subunit NuoF [Candidatus Krumholzibacteria bacterium]HRX50399.1 NADH-quinone oxidoreductase subunit NuoF [Candidatus Krumholzibacteria bacterium]